MLLMSKPILGPVRQRASKPLKGKRNGADTIFDYNDEDDDAGDTLWTQWDEDSARTSLSWSKMVCLFIIQVEISQQRQKVKESDLLSKTFLNIFKQIGYIRAFSFHSKHIKPLQRMFYLRSAPNHVRYVCFATHQHRMETVQYLQYCKKRGKVYNNKCCQLLHKPTEVHPSIQRHSREHVHSASRRVSLHRSILCFALFKV